MSQEAFLKIEGLICGYGEGAVLHGIDLDVFPGEVVSLLGANGAGKSTTLAAVSRLIPTMGGSIKFDGVDLRKLRAPEIVALGLIQVPERRQLFSGMSVEENLLLGGFKQGEKAKLKADLERCFELFPRLAERKAQLAKSMSGGEQQMLAIGRALMARPRLLLLDEPSLGLAPIFVNAVLELITKLRAEGTTILVVEQNAAAALKVSDRGYVMSAGRIAKVGSAKDLENDPMVQAAYLGGGDAGGNSMEARIRMLVKSTKE